MRIANLDARTGNGHGFYSREFREHLAAQERAQAARQRVTAQHRHHAPAHLSEPQAYPGERRLERWIDAHPRAAAWVHVAILGGVGSALVTLAFLWASE